MSFRWQDKHMELFLESYQRYECLWNNKCSDYSKSNVREKAYLSMLADLNLPGLTVPDIKAKIKTIRTRYGAELCKIKNSERSGASADDVYEPRLFWFKLADVFLRSICTPKESSSNLKELESTRKGISGKATDDSQHLEEREQQTEQTAHIQDTEQQTEQTAHIQDTEATSPNTIATSSAVITNTPKNTKGRKRSLNTTISGVQDAIKQLKTLSEENKEDLNEFDVFCESLAIQLKKMPLNRALICQEHLQKVMTQERPFQLTSNPQSHSSMSPADYQQSIPTSGRYSAMSSGQSSTHSRQSQNHYYQSTEKDDDYESTQYTSDVLSDALSSAGLIVGDELMPL
ncbi:uncharacterized protein LOC116174562 [Photinus pyralis]|uniref:uncharacterized protein LOC116174562 n=1 Tax=Photinus pyralis TaxID=7054 RepID=UPI001267724E|nr:uncharacterized protein LOC116174562 [Photinus pyralis]